MSDEPNLGQQALDKVAEMAIASQLDEVEEMKIDVDTDPLKLVQGKVNSIGVKSEGMVMKQDLRVESLKVQTESVEIDPLKAIAGKLKLTEPTKAQTKVLLTEADLNRAMQSDYLRPKMQGLKLQVEDQLQTIDILETQVRLEPDNYLSFTTRFLIKETEETKQLSATTILHLEDGGYRIGLEVIRAEENTGLSLPFVTALLQNLVKLLDLRTFELDGMSLQLKTLQVQEGQLHLQANTTVEKLPNSE